MPRRPPAPALGRLCQFLAYPREDGIEHRQGETTSLCILPARMVGSHQEYAIWEGRHSLMREVRTYVRWQPQRAPRREMASKAIFPRGRQRAHGVAARSRAAIGATRRYLSAGWFVIGRHTPSCRCDVGIVQRKTIIAVLEVG
jgi:hypothetical protein